MNWKVGWQHCNGNIGVQRGIYERQTIINNNEDRKRGEKD